MSNHPPTSGTPGGPAQLHKITSVLDRLQVGRSTFYGLVQQGKIRVLKINGASRVLASDLDAYIQGLPTSKSSDGVGSDHE
jgi:excisionase family DNA binding protein